MYADVVGKKGMRRLGGRVGRDSGSESSEVEKNMGLALSLSRTALLRVTSGECA